MSSRSKFYIVEQVYPDDTIKPFRILETVETSDGPRTRVVDGAWVSAADAMKQIELKEKA